MSDIDRYFHEVWLGMVQPIEGLVVSIPVLVDAQCMERQPPHVQQKLLSLCDEDLRIVDLAPFLAELLGLVPDLFDAGNALADEVSLYVPEGKQTIRPTMALKKPGDVAGYEMLVWEVPIGLDLDKPETTTGAWDYPPNAKFDRLLRHCRVPIGLLTNKEMLRLVYAPYGESSGAITFRVDDMASVGGRPILDAFVMLLSANRFFGVSAERSLATLLAESRTRQASVTNDLADQVFEALQILLRGFEAAAERDGRRLLQEALEREDDHLYKGLLTVLLRLVFLLYAEDRALLPVEQPVYAKHFSVLALFEELQADRGAYPDSMSRRFGAWGRLVALFRAVFLGCTHGAFQMPPRRGSLFNPHEYAFLEGWGPGGGAPITLPESRAEVRLPTVDDETIFRVLEKLLVLDGQRLSYRALDVEQIGSVYEALMGYHVARMPAQAVCMRPDRLWLTAEEVLEVPEGQRAKWLKDAVGISTAQAAKLSEELHGLDARAAIVVLATSAAGGKKDPTLFTAKAGQLVLQPGSERRRTSSHYTPRSLSAPIVRRTLEPLLAVMGTAPRSERILNLKICDPAMGSGAFLVEACRFLADHLLAAWTREGKVEGLAREHGDTLLHARRVVAQRCLYGVDKNDAAVELAKLSLWLVTLSKTLPFTFLDHCLRHGDSLVGLDFEQIRNFHWRTADKKPSSQLELFGREISIALDDAIQIRQSIGLLGDSPTEDREKARLFWDAQDAVDRVRLIGDLVIGAYFAHGTDRDRENERARRELMVREWLLSGSPAPVELSAMQRELRERLPVFHWMVEFPEVFYAQRPDPLQEDEVNHAAMMDAFVGNPPFLGQSQLSRNLGEAYRDWLFFIHPGAQGKADLVAHFFRRSDALLGLHGTIGLIATNTISQGDTRESGLQPMLKAGCMIYDAQPTMPWPGEASVAVAVVHLARGAVTQAVGRPLLDGRPVLAINSKLEEGEEKADPGRLTSNVELSFLGCKVGGQGFLLDEEQRAALIKRNKANSTRIFRYVGGEDVNTSPTHESSRFVIDFAQMTLEEASAWPDLLNIVREKVKPDRDKNNRESQRKYWWRFAEVQPAMRTAVASLERALVISQVTKHVVFAFLPTDQIASHKLYVFPLDRMSPFAVLQSRIHGIWAASRSPAERAHGSPSYFASDCFETFPFPESDPRLAIAALEEIGSRLYDARAKYMTEESVGLTVTYNRLKDPSCTDASILRLRKLHEDMDHAVIDAYAQGDVEGRWSDIEVPPFCMKTDAAKAKFEDAIVTRLFALNAKRIQQQNLKGLGSGKKPRKPTTSTKKSGARKKSGLQLQLEPRPTKADQKDG